MEITEQSILEIELTKKDHSISETIDSDKKIEEIVKALSSETRRRILKEIRIEPLDVSNISSKLGMTEANISAQIKKLEKAGLVTCQYSSGSHGVRKISSLKYDQLILNF